MIETEYQRWLKDKGRELNFSFDNIDSESIVWDVGMYKGDWTAEICKRYQPNIYSFEPVNSFYDSANKRFQGNKKITTFNFGLGDRNRFDLINIASDGTSLFTKKGNKTENIEVKDVFEIFTNSSLKSIDLLALNCEGAEYEILKRLIDTNIIDRFNQLFIQFHLLRESDSQLRDEIILLLSKTHIQIYCYTFVWELWKRKLEK